MSHAMKLIFFYSLLLLPSLFSWAQSPVVDTVANSFTKNFLFFPVVVKSPETKWGAGYATSYFFKTKKHDTLTRTSNVESIGLVTLRKQIVLMLGMNLYSPSEKYIFRMRNSFSKFPDKFWGLGDRSPKSAMEQYAFSQFFTNPQLLRRVYSKFYLGAMWEFQVIYNMHYEKNQLFDRTINTGKEGGVSSGGGVIAAWDTRNNAFSPDKGEFIQFSILKFARYSGSQVKFVNTVIDARKYFKIGRNQVLAFQAFGYFTKGNPPFRYLATFGGSDIMRGYYSGRYRDNNYVAIQAEYRFPIVWRLGMVVFAGVGDVSNKTLVYRFNPLKYSLGTGIRLALKPQEKLNFRIDFGWGHQSFASYVTITEAF